MARMSRPSVKGEKFRSVVIAVPINYKTIRSTLIDFYLFSKVGYSALSGAHFSVKLILAINGNLGVFGVANRDSGIRIAKLKMADPRWRLRDSNVEFFEQLTQGLLHRYFLSR